MELGPKWTLKITVWVCEYVTVWEAIGSCLVRSRMMHYKQKQQLIPWDLCSAGKREIQRKENLSDEIRSSELKCIYSTRRPWFRFSDFFNKNRKPAHTRPNLICVSFWARFTLEKYKPSTDFKSFHFWGVGIMKFSCYNFFFNTWWNKSLNLSPLAKLFTPFIWILFT